MSFGFLDLGVGILKRSVNISPVSAFTRAPLMPLPPISIPRISINGSMFCLDKETKNFWRSKSWSRSNQKNNLDAGSYCLLYHFKNLAVVTLQGLVRIFQYQ